MEKTVPSEEGEAILADRDIAAQVPAVALGESLQELRLQLRLANQAARVALWE